MTMHQKNKNKNLHLGKFFGLFGKLGFALEPSDFEGFYETKLEPKIPKKEKQYDSPHNYCKTKVRYRNAILGDQIRHSRH